MVNSELILKLNIKTLKHRKHKKAHGGFHGAAIQAGKLNLTAVGYARDERFNIYSCHRRIT